eukprot:3941721-Rhodomonas_salina.2
MAVAARTAVYNLATVRKARLAANVRFRAVSHVVRHAGSTPGSVRAHRISTKAVLMLRAWWL